MSYPYVPPVNNNPPKASPIQEPAIHPAPPLKVFDPDTPQEEEALAASFKGVTTNGELQKGLFAIKETGVSTLAIQKAASNFLAAISEE